MPMDIWAKIEYVTMDTAGVNIPTRILQWWCGGLYSKISWVLYSREEKPLLIMYNWGGHKIRKTTKDICWVEE